MKRCVSLSLGLSAFLLVGATVRNSTAQPLRTAEHIDLHKYVGRWHEIAGSRTGSESVFWRNDGCIQVER